MADSGVDTSNESSDNPIFDHAQCKLEFSPPSIPLNTAGQPMPVGVYGETHDHIGKIKCSTKARHSRLTFGHGGMMCSSSNQKLHFAAATNNSELVEKLLSSGADPNSSDERQRSPLHLAAGRGYVEVVKLLLRHGANPNIKDNLGNTPLHLAACTDHIQVVIELLEGGTNVSLHDNNGQNPIQLAISRIKSMQMHCRADFRVKGSKLRIATDVCMVLLMLSKFVKMEITGSVELVSIRDRLEQMSSQEEVDIEVKNLLQSLDSLNLQ